MQPLSPHAAETCYNAGLDSVAAKAQASITAQNRACRQQIMQELEAFFAVMPYQLSLQTCNPTDLLVFMERWYVPRHAGSLVRGQPMAAPSSISTVVSHLRMIFKELGRGQFWDHSQKTGNPASCPELHQWSQGHRNVNVAAG